MWSFSRVILEALALGALVSGYSDPERCTGSCYAHDPGFIRRSSDGEYFRFNTDTYIDIMKSSSISGPWTVVGNVLPNGSVIDLAADEGLWVSTLSLPMLYNAILRRRRKKLTLEQHRRQWS